MTFRGLSEGPKLLQRRLGRVFCVYVPNKYFLYSQNIFKNLSKLSFLEELWKMWQISPISQISMEISCGGFLQHWLRLWHHMLLLHYQGKNLHQDESCKKDSGGLFWLCWCLLLFQSKIALRVELQKMLKLLEVYFANICCQSLWVWGQWLISTFSLPIIEAVHNCI